MQTETRQRIGHLVAFTIVAVTIVGYFVGLQAPMSASPHLLKTEIREQQTHSVKTRKPKTENSLPATAYRDMATVTGMNMSVTHLASLNPSFDSLLAEVRIEPDEKKFALAARARNRAFNGAPPTIPHPIDQRSSASCAACHGRGFKTTSLRIPRMSHEYLENCTQCHVESRPVHATESLFRENGFEGLAPPESGPRAFAQAPPQIPHTTWMRSDCMSCHGDAGLNGIRTTHPWRKNCQQCHAPSSKLDQTLLATEPQFLRGPKLRTQN